MNRYRITCPISVRGIYAIADQDSKCSDKKGIMTREVGGTRWYSQSHAPDSMPIRLQRPFRLEVSLSSSLVGIERRWGEDS